MPVPFINASTGMEVSDNRQSTYGGGLGSIYQYGHQMPAGPFSFLPHAPSYGNTANGAAGGGGNSSTTAHTGPTDSATTFYNSVLSGQQMPYTQDVQDNMLSDASDQTAAAETAQHQAMVNHAAASGGSASDPSMQGSANEAAAARQAGNVKAKQNISEQADQGNFSAKENAASHLMDYDLQQQGFQNGMQKTALGFLPFNQGGSQQQSGGNNFGGSGGFYGYQPARMGDFNPPRQAPNQYGRYSNSDYENMGL